MRTKILSANVLAGGGERTEAIATRIESHNPDVVVLSEVRANTVAGWIKAMEARGFLHSSDWIDPPARQPDALMIFSRDPFEHLQDNPPFPCRSRTIRHAKSGITLISAHVWTSKTKLAPGGKMLMWEWLMSRVQTIPGTWMLIGDLNTGDVRDRRRGYRKRFTGERYFESLTREAGSDLWRLHHGERTEWSWISTEFLKTRRDEGFRLDHAIGSNDLRAVCSRCDYDHDFRAFNHETGQFVLSDHSAIIVEVDQKSDAPRSRDAK